jgi:hypothetical protein
MVPRLTNDGYLDKKKRKEKKEKRGHQVTLIFFPYKPGIACHPDVAYSPRLKKKEKA